MSTKTFHTYVTKKLTFGVAAEQVYIFNNPEHANAFETVEFDGTTPLKVNQWFREITVDNGSNFDCFVSFNPNIAASVAAVHGVARIASKDVIRIEHPGFTDLRIYLAGAGDVRITLK